MASVSTLATPLHGQNVPEWRLAAPTFEVGGVEAEGDYTLTSLGGAAILPSGNVLVADRQAPFLKLFTSDGTFLRDLAGFGSGPGEHEYVYRLDRCAPNELTTQDVSGREHRYTGSMEHLATELVSLSSLGGGVAYNWDCHPNGLRVVTGWGDHATQFRPGYFRATAKVLLLRGQDVVFDFGERLSSERIGSTRADGTPTGSGPHPLGRATVVALGEARVYLGDAAAYEIEVYDLAGRPLPPLRWDGPSLEYSDRLVRQLAQDAISAASESSRARVRRMYDELPDLDQLPAYDRLLVSDVDELWVRQFPRPGAAVESWVVFDRDGDLVGRIAFPVGSTLWEVRGRRALYSLLDEFDVPVVRISAIER